MTHFDLFSGYGGFTLALERIYGQSNCSIQYSKKRRRIRSSVQSDGNSTNNKSWNGMGEQITIGFSEIDKYASAVLKYRFPNVKNYGDIKSINWSEVPDFDLLTGGSPCQDLSIAGKRAGLSGERSGLFYEYMRAVREKKPKYFIWENVKGALSSRNGWDFAAVINEMAEAGYSLWWQILNAKDFGVPQNRERIFVVGFRDKPAPEIFFERASNQEDIKQLNNPTHSNNRLYGDDGISPALNTAQGGNRQPKILRQPLKFLDRNQKNIEGDYAFTVDSMNTGGVKVDSRIRRLTPTECERLMGLPDGWTSRGIIDGKEVDISDTQRYKLCGNGVVVNVVEEIIKSLLIT